MGTERDGSGSAMIRATSSNDGSSFVFSATVRGFPIYLDNWAIGDLAEGDRLRRKRFVAAVCNGGADLMFSVTNAAQLWGPLGKSFDAVKSFLNEVGPNWFPVELDPFMVVQREQNGANSSRSCVSEGFMKAYFVNRRACCSPDSGTDLSEAFSGLGEVLDWVGIHRDSLREQAVKLDAIMRETLNKHRTKYKRNPSPAMPFNPSQPATFASVNLVRTLILESNQLKPGDALDFFHAVMASAFASVAALDKHWKRRVESLPKPNGLAHIYYQPELDKMVRDIELWLKHSGALH